MSAEPGAAAADVPWPVREETYTTWGRDIVDTARRDPQADLLFDSSIDEPEELLQARIRASFCGGAPRHYQSTFSRGNPYVLEALAARYGFPREGIVCTTGASSGVAIACSAFLNAGSHAIVERPYFDFLPAVARERGAHLSFVDRAAPHFGLDVDRLEMLVRPETRLVVLTDLHNPSGARLGPEALDRLAALAERTGVRVVIDEVYGDFLRDDPRHGVAARHSPHFVSVNSLTKVYGLFALKCGWIMAGAACLPRIIEVYDRFEFGLSKVSHTVAAAVLEDMAPFERHWRGLLSRARPTVAAHAAALEREGLLSGAVPEAGCMYFPRLHGVDDVEFSRWLWRERRVAVAPGRYFGAPGHVRIGFGRSADRVEAGMIRFGEGLRRYRELA